MTQKVILIGTSTQRIKRETLSLKRDSLRESPFKKLELKMIKVQVARATVLRDLLKTIDSITTSSKMIFPRLWTKLQAKRSMAPESLRTLFPTLRLMIPKNWRSSFAMMMKFPLELIRISKAKIIGALFKSKSKPRPISWLKCQTLSPHLSISMKLKLIN